jgi:hypothetical protein
MNRAHAFFVRAMGAAVENTVRLDTVANNLAIAMTALRCERMNGALKAVKEMRFTLHYHLDDFVVIVPAHFTFHHNSLLVAARYT